MAKHERPTMENLVYPTCQRSGCDRDTTIVVAGVARCATCYIQDLYRAGHGALQSLLPFADEKNRENLNKLIVGMKSEDDPNLPLTGARRRPEKELIEKVTI